MTLQSFTIIPIIPRLIYKLSLLSLSIRCVDMAMVHLRKILLVMQVTLRAQLKILRSTDVLQFFRPLADSTGFGSSMALHFLMVIKNEVIKNVTRGWSVDTSREIFRKRKIIFDE